MLESSYGKWNCFSKPQFPVTLGKRYLVDLATGFILNLGIVLFKMFSRLFFANKKLIITPRTSKIGDVT